jgi:hypothetical protein
MRYISYKYRYLSKIAPREPMLVLKSCNEKIHTFTDDEDRRKFIDKNGAAWSNISEALWLLGNCKCWYSEAFVQESEGQVEHFRPKKQVWGTNPSHGGYWWDAFNYKNFRLAHPTVNKRTTDYVTKQLAGKGCYFPLQPGSQHAIQESEESNEIPLLLDPTVSSDCELICFDISSGIPIPKHNASEDPEIDWYHTRASKTIDYYHLDEGDWNGTRFDIMAAVQQICMKLLKHKKSGNIKKYAKCIQRLSDYISPQAEFTSAAKQAMIEKLGKDEFIEIYNSLRV